MSSMNRVSISGKAVPHESARGHVTGEALYTDDLAGRFPKLLHAWPVLSPHAHAIVKFQHAALHQEHDGRSGGNDLGE